MGVVGGNIGYRLLRKAFPSGESSYMDGSQYQNRSKIEVLLGPGVWDEIKDKDVIDFGCGAGAEAIEMAHKGAKTVMGIDIRETLLTQARELAERSGVARRCFFATKSSDKADIVISLDAFEHFSDPADILQIMRGAIKHGGCALIAFGPTWYHPLGGHLFSVFPWAHLVFTEKALIRWRSDFKADGATRFSEVEGGLNQMTIGRFERLIAKSGFRIDTLELIPIRATSFMWTPLLREFLTAIVRCRLAPR